MIFFDAFLIILYDSARSKYAMLLKKQKRKLIELPESRRKVLNFAWIGTVFFITCLMLSYVWWFFRERNTSSLYNFDLIPVILGICVVCNTAIVFLFSTTIESRKRVFRKLLQERRVIFIVILLGILFYVDGIYWVRYDQNGRVFTYLFPVGIMMYIMSDFLCVLVPRKMMLILLICMLLLLFWQILRHLLFVQDCKSHMFDWGILGEKISYCTIRRFTYQSIASLLIPAALQTILRRRNINMNFCNANLYRSSGTTHRSFVNPAYVSSMKLERTRSIQRMTRKQTLHIETV